MTTKWTHRNALFALLVMLAAPVAIAAAGTPVYDLGRQVIAGGGTSGAPGGVLSLSGTIGQPATGALYGGRYALGAGFWGGAARRQNIYVPLVMRGA